ncbi:MAG: MFS transporter [Bryobacteraceae bacterium]|nr:MFS transporter [Bryobacteraceae bacterium]MDW8379208.1 MFS transporter [Bryobacterales bacterium]
MKAIRWQVAALLFAATVINYIDRQTLSVIAAKVTKELGISNTEYANILTAFLIPYTAMYVVSGWMVDRFGTRLSLALFMAWWSLANALHALARGAWSLGVFRFLLGMGESGNFMAAEKAISEWFPARERALANGLVNAAAATGAILAPPLIAWITLLAGWRFSFVLTGALGFFWLVAWLLIYHVPAHHPRISEQERRYIEQGRVERTDVAPSYRDLLCEPATWGLLVSRVLADPVWWFYLFWLPKYLQEVRHFSLAQIALFAWMPYLSADIGSLAGGWLSGRWIRRGRSAIDARKLTMIPVALLMPLGAFVAELPAQPAMALICLVTFLHMAWKTNLMTMTNDVFPSAMVGRAAGVVGLGSGLGGALSTPVVGRVVDAFGYHAVFWIMGFLHLFATICVLLTVRRSFSPREQPGAPGRSR